MKQWVASLVPQLAAKLEKEEEEQSKKKKPLTIAIGGQEIRSTGKMKGLTLTAKIAPPKLIVEFARSANIVWIIYTFSGFRLTKVLRLNNFQS